MKTLLARVALFLICGSVQGTPIVIDHFDGNCQVMIPSGPGPNSAGPVTCADPGALGGSRTLSITRDAGTGTGTVSMDSNLSQPSLLTISTGGLGSATYSIL